MVSRSKLFEQLERLELELKEQLLPHLERAVSGKNDLIFCVQEFNTHHELKSKTDKNTEQMIHIGRKILTLHKKLGESSEGSIAERLCWYCREWSNLDHHNKKNTQELAKQFMNEIVSKP